MYIYRKIKAKVVWSFAWKSLLLYTLQATAVYFLFHWLDHQGIDAAIPFAPLGTIGVAVAFYVGFKNNHSYDRFWEGRKIWGGIVNASRTWANMVLSFSTMRHAQEGASEEELKQLQKRLIYRQLAWINALRLQLRRASSFSIQVKNGSGKRWSQERPGEIHWKEEVGPFLPEAEIAGCKKVSNVAAHLVRHQGEDLKYMMDQGYVEDFRHMELMAILTEFYTLQGQCERINNTPLPRQYAYFSTLFVYIFIFLLPFGLTELFQEMGHGLMWLMIPFHVIIAWIFYTMEVVGDSSEDPFEGFINDVPMTALCRTIEIDLREMLGETDIPPKVEAVDGVLM